MINQTEPDGERLQKILSRRGYGSRRKCEELISLGRVKVNGELARLGQRVVFGRDRVEVDGAPVSSQSDCVYYLFNKPAAVICSADDPQGRKTIYDYVPSTPRVFSIGRLDYDSEGLIILTNDGEFANLLAHPSKGVEKHYVVELDCTPTANALRQLRKGVQLDDGLTSPAKVSQMDAKVLKIVIHEGRNRQVRRMCEVLGYNVTRLVRVSIGSVADRSLKPGQYRELTLQEVKRLATEGSHSRGRNGN